MYSTRANAIPARLAARPAASVQGQSRTPAQQRATAAGGSRTPAYDRAMSAVGVAVAEAHGVRCEKPIVLREAWHVLVHLWPSPIVARVTSGAPGVDPDGVKRELSVAVH